MLPGKRDFYRCCKARRSASHVNKEFWQQFQNYAPPSLRVIRTKFARTIIGERAKQARHSQVCSIENRGYIYRLYIIGERSEPLSRVFNDQSRGIYIYMVESVRTYVSNTHAHVRMSICY